MSTKKDEIKAKKLWEEVIQNYNINHMTFLGHPPFFYEFEIFMPYTMYIDKINSTITFKNRMGCPLGYDTIQCDGSEVYEYFKINLSALPKVLKVGLKDEIFDREVTMVSLYIDGNRPLTEKRHTDNYISKIVSINNACEKSFFMNRFETVITDLYESKKEVEYLRIKLQKKEECIKSMREDIRSLLKKKTL